MTPQGQPEDQLEFEKVFLLTHVTEEERSVYLGTSEDHVEDGLEWLKTAAHRVAFETRRWICRGR